MVSPFSSTVKPASWMMRSAVRDSPTLASFWSMNVVPSCMLRKSDATTKTSQPTTAVFQCRALQPPTLAATFRLRFGGGVAPAPGPAGSCGSRCMICVFITAPWWLR